ncbi:MAG: hypothetical protein DCC68_15775 [Planctomycetota bacterium]|nr:MAG: hypothetical protein DCC68_15775 [Planctomycetota bacterium]
MPRSWSSAVGSFFGRSKPNRRGRSRERRGPSRRQFEPLEQRLVLAAVVNNVPTWEFSGPTSILGAGGEGLEPDPTFPFESRQPASGAVNSIAVHPTSTNTVYIGTANGGVWKTSNIAAASPDWEPLTDNLKNLSIGAVAINPTFQPTAPFHHPIIAGIGKHSNSGSFPGGLGGGIYRSLDSGATWTTHGEVELSDADVTGIAFVENSLSTILVSADNRDTQSDGGLFRSTDGGTTWSRVKAASGLTTGVGKNVDRVTHVVQDHVHNVFYAAVPFGGVFRGDSQGQNWTLVNNGISGTDLSNSARIRLAVNTSTDGTHVVFAAIINGAGKLQALYRSIQMGEPWQKILPLPSSNEAALDGIDTDNDPATDENAEETFYGLIPGGQGATNFSMTVDATDAHVIWLGGDRQDELNNNQAGCLEYSGRIFRGEIASDGTATWVQFVCGNTSRSFTVGANTTFIGTAPHADSRDMAFLPDGNLLETDDGGIHVLLNPRGLTGAGVPERHWQSRNGDLAVTEIVGAAYNRLTNNVLIGAQDNSSSRGPLEPANDAERRWSITQGGDGFIQGFAVENPNASGNGTGMEYAMNNTLRSFRRREATGGPTDIQLASKAGADRFSGLSKNDKDILGRVTVRKFAINEYEQKDPVHRLVLGGFDLYESDDRGDTIKILKGSGEEYGFVSALAYGTSDNHFAIYVARQKTLAVREKKDGAFAVTLLVGCDKIRDISVNQNDWHEAYAVDNLCVHRTLDGGLTWETIFRSAGKRMLYSIELVTHPSRVLFVGTTQGVMQALEPNAVDSLTWSNFGKGLPNALVSNLIYDKTDRVLIAATTGRGVWHVNLPVTSGQTFNVPLNVGGEMIVTGTSGDDSFTLRRRAEDPSLVDVFVNPSTTPAATAPLSSLRQIVVNGLAGDDRLILDSTNGAIAPGFANGRITFNAGEDFGGADQDSLEFQGGGSGEVYADLPLAGDEIFGDFVFALVQRSRDVEGVQTFGLESIEDHISQPPVLIDTLDTLKNGLIHATGATVGFSQASAEGQTGCLAAPLFGCSASQVGAGAGLERPDVGNPLDDEAVAATSFRRAFQNPGRAILERMFTNGQTSLLLSDIGNPDLDTLDELEARLEALDDVPNNVSFTTDAAGLPQFNVAVKQRLTGSADLDLSVLNGRIGLRGSVETSADVTMNLVFGIDDRGFYIDTENGASRFTIGNFGIGKISALGRLGPVRVTAEAGTLTSDSDAHLEFAWRNPADDPFFPNDAAEDHRIRLYEIDAPIASLFRASIDGDPGDGVADLEFVASYAVSVFNINVTDAKVRFTWNDLAQPNVVQFAPVPAETSGEESFGEKVMRLLDIDANTIVDNLLVLADHFQDTIDASSGIFAREVPILGKTLGDLLGDEVNPVELTNEVGQPPESQPIRSVSPPVVVDDELTFDVKLNGESPASLGIAVGDPVVFRATGGPLPELAGNVIRVEPDSITIAYPDTETQTPDDVTPSLRVLVGGALVDKIRSALGDAAEDEQQEVNIPTIDDLLERLAQFTGIDSLAETTLDLDTRRLTIPLSIDPEPLRYTHRLDLGERIEGLNFDGSGDLNVEIDPAFNLVVGIDFSPNLSLAERLFIVEQPDDPLTTDVDERIDATLDVRLSVDDPVLTGRLGFLGVSLLETPPPVGETNDGVQLELNVAVDLVEPDTPGVGAGDDRFSLDEITAANLLDVFDASADGFVDIDGLTMSASIAGAPPFANINLALDGESGVAAPGHLESLDAADISELIAGFQVTGDLFGYESFNNLSAGDLILLVNQLGNALNGMTSGLNPSGGIPLVDKGVEAVADFGEMLADFTADLINDDGTPKFTTFQDLVPALGEALGLDPAQIMPSYDPVFNELKVKIQLAHAFSPESVALDFNAGGSALSFTASADANFVLNANLGITLGMRLDDELDFEDRLFIQSGGALTLTGGIGASDIDLGASLGLLGVGVQDGSIAISLGPQVTLGDPAAVPDGRITLAELLDDPLGVIETPTLVANVTGELPLVVSGVNLGIDPLNPPAIDISLATPNDLSSIQFVPNAAFEDLLADFADFDLEDVAAMVQSLVDLLQSADIGVFDRDLPLVNRSVNDLLGVVDSLAATVLEVSQNLDISQILFGLTDFQLATAALPDGTDIEGLAGVITSLLDLLDGDAPETKKSELVSILAQLRTEIDKLPATVNGQPLDKTSLNNAHASLDLATSSVQAIGRILSDALGIAAPSSLTVQLTDANPNPAVFERALIARLHLVKNAFNVARPIGFDVGQFGPIQVSGGGDITLNVGGTLDLDVGYNLARRRAFLLESSQISATAQGAVNKFQVDVGIAGVTGSIDSGTIALGNGGLPASIGVNVIGGDAFGVIYFGTDTDPATDDFDVTNLNFAGVQGALTASLPLSVDLFGPVGTVQVSFDLATQNLDFQVPDVAAAIAGGPFNFGLWVQGIDLVLAGIQAGLESETLGKLPVIGDNLNLAGDLVGDFRENFLDPIQAAIADPTNLENRLKQVILDKLGGVAGGLGILRPAGTDCLAAMPAAITNVNLVDVDIDNAVGEAHINVHLCGEKSFQSDFALDLGGVNLGIETSGGVHGSATYDLELGFGLSKTDGFFFTLDTQPGDPEEVEVEFSAFLDSGTTLDAKLFFLQVEASDDTGSTGVSGGLTIDFLDQGLGAPDRLGLNEIIPTSISALIDARVDADADISLHVEASAAIANDGFLPSIAADLMVDWSFSHTFGEPGEPGQLRPTFEIRDLSLSLGEFLSRVASPIALKVNKYVEPIRPILDMLNSRIPGLADAADALGFGPHTWAEAISFFGGSGGESIARLIRILTAVDNFVADVVALNGQPIEINFGDFTFGNQDLRSGAPNLDAATPVDFIVTATGLSPTVTSQAGAAGGILADAAADPDNDDDGLGISFPILRNPANLLKLLFGQVVDLVVWDVKPLEFEFTVDQEWPVFPPLPIFVGIGGVVSAKADFLVGFDTRGIKQTGRFFDGFYIGDTPGPEIELFAGVEGSLAVNLLVVEVGGEARLGANFTADWHDGNNDGKLYFDELVRQVSGGGLKCVFDFEGSLVAEFNLFADPAGKGEDNKRVFPDPPIDVTLFEFPLPSCPAQPPIDTAHHDFGRLPDEPASVPEREILVLNSGPFAPMREQATQRKTLNFLHPGVSEVDEAETFTVRQTGPDTFEVTAYGVTQIFTGPKAILATMGDSNDVIVIDPSVTVPVYIDGGDDDDVLDAPPQSTVSGGDGDDFMPRYPRPGLGGKVIGGLGHDIVDIRPDFIPPDLPIDWTIEDGRYGFGANPLDGDGLFDVDEFGITGTAAEDRFDVGNWTGIGTLRGDAGDAVVDTRFNHTEFTLGADSLDRGGSAGNIALDGIGRATLGNVGNDAPYSVHDAGWQGAATINAGPGSHTFTSSRDADVTLSDTAVSFGNGGAFAFAGAPIRNANFTGGAGATTYSLQNWNGTATIDGGGGHDRIVYSVAEGTSNATTAIGATSIARCFTLRCVPDTNVGGVIYSGIDEIELIGTPGADNLSAGLAPFLITIRGRAGNDNISGSAFDDSLFGEEGDDTITGIEGIDLLDGGPDNDTLVGFFEPGGEDNLVGGPGIDRVSETRDRLSWNLFDTHLSIDGDYTANFIAGDIEDALLQGGGGANQFTLTSWSGTATLEGFDGTDTIFDAHDVSFGLSDALLTRSGLGSITLVGIEGANLGTVSSTASQTFADNGWHGSAIFSPGGGTDALVSQRDANFTLAASQYLPSDGGTFQLINSAFESAQLTGGAGANEFNVGGWIADLTLDGGGGTDTLLYNTAAFSNNAATIALSNTTVDRTVLGMPRGHVAFSSIENRIIVGSSAGDTIDASAATIRFSIDGAAGPDSLIGGSGPDTLVGGAGNDTLEGGLGNDSLSGGADNDRYVYTAAWGSDTLVEAAAQGTDTLDFSAVNGTSTASILTTGLNIAGSGSGVAYTGSSIEAIFGGIGNDTINVSNGASLAGGNGTIDGGGGVNTLAYTAFTTPVTVNLSTLSGTGFANVLNVQNVVGGTVGDSITGNNADNQLEGRNGNDTLVGLGGNDILIDGTGSDSLDGGDGDDTFRIGHTSGATETIGDASGSDTLDYAASTGSRVVDLDNTTATQQVFTNQFLRINTGVVIENYLGSQGIDTLSIDPLDRATRNVVGNNPTGAPGDVLNYDGKNAPAVIASGSVHSGGFRPVTFSLWETTNLANTLDPPPMVIAVRVGFANPAIPFFDIPVGSEAQLVPIPWTGVRRIQLAFSENVQFGEPTDLQVIGVANTYEIDPGAFTYDSVAHTATWSLENSIASADKVLLRMPSGRVVDFQGNDLDGEWQDPLPLPGAKGSVFPSGDIFPGGDFVFRFNVVPGDVNQNGTVDLADFHAQRNRQFRSQGDTAYDVLFDTDRSGHINVADGVLLLNHRGQSLPSGEPAPSPAAAPAAAAADATAADAILSRAVRGDAASAKPQPIAAVRGAGARRLPRSSVDVASPVEIGEPMLRAVARRYRMVAAHPRDEIQNTARDTALAEIATFAKRLSRR